MKRFLSFIAAIVIIVILSSALNVSNLFVNSSLFRNLIEGLYDKYKVTLFGELDIDIITNEGAGLPTADDGVFEVDFTKGELVKNATELGYYIDGCPTMGNSAVLVIPVEFKDIKASTSGYSIDDIKKAFVGESEDGKFYSVHDYYYISSYGQLDLDITVIDEWFCPENNSSYYESLSLSEETTGEQMVINEALDYLDDKMDLSKFDSDGNGTIDSVVIIETLAIDSAHSFNWAYRYWNEYTDDNGDYYEYDGVRMNDYIWASCEFMYDSGNRLYVEDIFDTSIINNYTYIHELGHVLGADDYYDLSRVTDPLDGYDIMDTYSGDHNPYTKFNYGWIENSRLIVTDKSVTVTLESFTETGDTIIIANNFDESLGVYQEYYIISYYTNTGLNKRPDGYFEEAGIVVYHVNSSLTEVEMDSETYYLVYNDNTFALSGGTYDTLIEIIRDRNGGYVYTEGETLRDLTDDCGYELCYTFTVDSVKDGVATLTFTKR